MSTTVQNIKERLSIVEIISSYIDIEKSGSNFKAKCPFHHEKTASFFISPDRGSYYCFGCGVKGDIFTFVQEFEGIDFLAALHMLASKAGVVVEKKQKDQEGEDKEVRLYRILEDATVFFQTKLKDNMEALSYLKKRGLEIETVRLWKIGFAPNEWRELKTYLLQKGYSEEEMLVSGLIKKPEQGESYDRFRGRIMFPLCDTLGRVVAFSGRILNPSKDDEAKYLNSPDTPLFDKSKLLYGFNFAKSEIRKKQSVILVEGQMDLLMSHQAGVINTVASSGTALTQEHLLHLRRLTDRIIIAFDADNAGQNATLRAWKLALKEGFVVHIVNLPSGLDPADSILKDKNIWIEAIAKSQGVVSYFIDIMKSKSGKDADDILKQKLLPLVKMVQSGIDQTRYLQEISFASGIGEKVLESEMQKIIDEDVSSVHTETKVNESQKRIPEALSFALYLDSKKHPFAVKFKELLLLIDPAYQNKIPKDENYISKILFEIEMHYGDVSLAEKIGNTLLYHYEESLLKEDFAKTMERLKRSELVRDIPNVEKELKHCQDISTKLSGLSKKYANP